MELILCSVGLREPAKVRPRQLNMSAGWPVSRHRLKLIGLASKRFFLDITYSDTKNNRMNGWMDWAYNARIYSLIIRAKCKYTLMHKILSIYWTLLSRRQEEEGHLI